MNYHRNGEGYRDPTAGAALGYLIRQEKRKLKRHRKKAKRALPERPLPHSPLTDKQEVGK